MGKFYRELSEDLVQFIQKQHIFFVATAPSDEGRINVSPKGYDTLRVIDHRRLSYLDYTGSGNETANHMDDNSRITFMWCSFEQKPMILRVYGYAQVLKRNSPELKEWIQRYDPETNPAIARQVFVVQIEAVQTSCGFGVPLMEYKGDRETMSLWTENKLANEELDLYIENNEQRNDKNFPIQFTNP